MGFENINIFQTDTSRFAVHFANIVCIQANVKNSNGSESTSIVHAAVGQNAKTFANPTNIRTNLSLSTYDVANANVKRFHKRKHKHCPRGYEPKRKRFHQHNHCIYKIAYNCSRIFQAHPMFPKWWNELTKIFTSSNLSVNAKRIGNDAYAGCPFDAFCWLIGRGKPKVKRVSRCLWRLLVLTRPIHRRSCPAFSIVLHSDFLSRLRCATSFYGDQIQIVSNIGSTSHYFWLNLFSALLTNDPSLAMDCRQSGFGLLLNTTQVNSAQIKCNLGNTKTVTVGTSEFSFAKLQHESSLE